MTPEEAIRNAKAGDLAPIYVIVGEERYLAARVVAAVREAALKGGLPEFNEDKLVAGEADVRRVLSAVRMAPMMAPRRLVVVSSLERWDARANEDDGGAESSGGGKGQDDLAPLDRLAEYAASPIAETCLVLWGAKMDGRKRLVAMARKGGWLIVCEPLARNALPAWILREAESRGTPASHDVVELLAELAGPDLATVADALERVSLYVGRGAPITEEAISACVIRVRQRTVWELVGAVGRQRLPDALRALDDVYDPRDRGLRLVGLLAWSIRQLIRFEAARRGGASPEDAARQAGAPPFKARELAEQLRGVAPGKLERWLRVLADTDLALKGSRRPARAILEDAIMQMCTATAA